MENAQVMELQLLVDLTMGKYYNDYEYIPNLGDLDQCNGIQRSITVNTPSGQESFPYFYVVTSTFPQIGRCFSGIPDNSFL